MARNKFSNIKTCEDGYTFASKKEHARYCELKLLRKAGEIRDIEVHPKYAIDVNRAHICTVILDFFYRDRFGVEHHEDVKGMDTAMSKLRRKLVEASHGIRVEVL